MSLSTEQLDALLHQPEQSSSDPELTSLRAVLTDLRTASLAAANHHQSRASIVPARAHGALWAAFATAAVLLCAATPLAFHHHPTPIQPIAAAPQPRPAAITDDALFADVQADINASVPSSLLPLTNDTTTSTTQKDTQ